MTDIGHYAITEAITYLASQLAAGNPYVVLGPSLDDDDYTPAEGVGIVINGINSGAAGFPAEPGHAYTFGLDIDNIFQIMAEESANGLYYRMWDNVGENWNTWEQFALEPDVPILSDTQGGIDYYGGMLTSGSPTRELIAGIEEAHAKVYLERSGTVTYLDLDLPTDNGYFLGGDFFISVSSSELDIVKVTGADIKYSIFVHYITE